MNKITADQLARRACVYIRQSTPDQVRHNLESQRRQYALAERARALGWQEVDVIDQDLVWLHQAPEQRGVAAHEREIIREQHGELIVACDAHEHREQLTGLEQESHVRVEVGRLNTEAPRPLDLRPQLHLGFTRVDLGPGFLR